MSDDRVTVDRHMCLTEDGRRVVEETDPRARWLKWSPGTEVSKEEYDRLTEPVPAPLVGRAKKRAPAANKSRRPQANK